MRQVDAVVDHPVLVRPADSAVQALLHSRLAHRDQQIAPPGGTLFAGTEEPALQRPSLHLLNPPVVGMYDYGYILPSSR